MNDTVPASGGSTAPRGGHTTLLAVVALLATLLAGVAIGFVASHAFMRHSARGPSPRSTHFLVQRLDRRLDLTPQQEREISRIIDESHTRISGVWRNVHPQVQQEIQRTNAQIEQVLTPDQREKFAEIKMRMGPRRPPRAGFRRD